MKYTSVVPSAVSSYWATPGSLYVSLARGPQASFIKQHLHAVY